MVALLAFSLISEDTYNVLIGSDEIRAPRQEKVAELVRRFPGAPCVRAILDVNSEITANEPALDLQIVAAVPSRKGYHNISAQINGSCGTSILDRALTPATVSFSQRVQNQNKSTYPLWTELTANINESLSITRLKKNLTGILRGNPRRYGPESNDRGFQTQPNPEISSRFITLPSVAAKSS